MTSLQDICHLITDGKHGDCQNKENSGFYFVSCKDVKDGWVDYSGAREITEADFFDTHKRTQLEPNDILITNSGTIGRMALVPNTSKTDHTTFQKSVAIVKPDKEKVIPEWLYYSLRGNRDALIASAGGTAQKNLLLRDLRAFSITVPPLPTQKKIAAILSAYDDLIENNTRRIKILEEMAQALYREWFVEFRFPGHEDVEMVDDGCGRMVPEGWEVVPIPDAIEINPRIKIPKDGLKPFLPMGYLSETSMLIHGFEYREGNSGSKFQNGDTLFARITPCLENGKTAFVQFLQSDNEIGFGSTEFIVLRSKSVTPEFVYLLARTEEFRDHAIKSMSGATGRQRVRTESLEQYLIAHPDKKSLEFFTGIVRPMFEEINNLAKKNQNLTQTRDLLLPRLIEREVDVSEIDISI